MAVLVEQTIDIYRGENVLLPFTTVPLEDISGWTLQFTVAKKTDSTSKLIGPLPMTITSGPLGQVQVQLTEEQLDLKAGTYVWDVWRTDEGFEGVKGIGPFVMHGDARVPPIE